MTEKVKIVLREYQERNRRGKYIHSVPEIALRAKIPPAKVVSLALQNGLKKRVIVHSDSVVKAALADYVNHPSMFTKDIADKYGIAAATLTVWAENAGITLRSRGLHKLDEPTARQKEILELATILPYEKVGGRYGITRARVGAIVKRWKGWKVSAEPPFKPGDIIEWRNKGKKKERLTVIDADITHGTMLDKRGRILRSFTWDTGGRLPKKVGVDQRYTVVKNGNGTEHSKAA